MKKKKGGIARMCGGKKKRKQKKEGWDSKNVWSLKKKMLDQPISIEGFVKQFIVKRLIDNLRESRSKRTESEKGSLR